MAVKIVIDAGHGGYDAGATYNGRREKDDTLALALAVGEILEAQGYDVVYTRTDDVYDSPVQKARIGNESGADFFVSIHRNSSPTPNQYNGVQTLIYNNAGLKATMAENVNKELEQVGYRNINVVERPDLAVLRRTRMPAILVEAGFINSDVDNNLFDTKFSETAEAIARGIDETIRDAGYTVAQGNMRSDVAQVSAPVSEEMYIAKSENDASGTQMVNEYYGMIIEIESIYSYFDEIDMRIHFHLDCTFLQEINENDLLKEKEVYYYKNKYYSIYTGTTDSNIIYKTDDIFNKCIRVMIRKKVIL